jgi:hypothetical protein
MDDDANASDDGVTWENELPHRSTDQSCALCGADRPQWLHPLDPNLVQYRVHGKGYTLPTFWCLCSRCERLYQRGLGEDLIDIMRANPAWGEFDPADVAECVAQPLMVFRRADLEPRKLS